MATLVLGFIVYHYEPLASLGNAAYRSSYFFANFFCYKYLGGYFAGLAEAHPLLNLWSLSVEEQFYLIIPCAMLLLWLVWKRGILAIILLTALGSFIYAEVLLSNQMIPSNATKAFYLLAPRAWELLLGMALVMMPAVKLKECWSKLLAAVGLVLVMASYVLLGEATTFPGMGALASTFGACLLIRYGAPGILGRVLSSRPVVGIGRISYSLYLWHWPVIVYINYFTEDSPAWWLLAFAVVLSFIISYASWKYIEMPVRRNRNISFGKAMAGLGICCVSVGIVGYTLDKSEGLVNYIHQDANKYKSLDYPRKLVPVDSEKTGIPQLSALDEKGKMVKGIVRHLGDKGVSPDFVLMGDSHADAMQIGLDDICAEKKRGGIALAFKTCPLTDIDITHTFNNICEPIMEWLKKVPQLKTVILVCRWETRLTFPKLVLFRRGGEIPPDNSGNYELLREGLMNTCRRLKESGREVVLLGPVPTLPFSPGTLARQRIMLGGSIENLGDFVSEREFYEQQKRVIELLKECENAGVARIVWVHPALLKNGGFCGIDGDSLLYHDSNHLSGEGSRKVARKVYEQIFPQVKPEQEKK